MRALRAAHTLWQTKKETERLKVNTWKLCMLRWCKEYSIEQKKNAQWNIVQTFHLLPFFGKKTKLHRWTENALGNRVHIRTTSQDKQLQYQMNEWMHVYAKFKQNYKIFTKRPFYVTLFALSQTHIRSHRTTIPISFFYWFKLSRGFFVRIHVCKRVCTQCKGSTPQQ